MDPPSQSSIDTLHTATPTARSSTMHIYRRQMDPLSQSPTYALYTAYPLLDPVPHSRSRRPTSQLTIDALHTNYTHC